MGSEMCIRDSGVDHEPVAVHKNPRRDSKMLNLLAIKISQHRFRRRQVHRQVMMRTLKQFGFGRVAINALTTPHETRNLFVGQGVVPVSNQVPGEHATDHHPDQHKQNDSALI